MRIINRTRNVRGVVLPDIHYSCLGNGGSPDISGVYTVFSVSGSRNGSSGGEYVASGQW